MDRTNLEDGFTQEVDTSWTHRREKSVAGWEDSLRNMQRAGVGDRCTTLEPGACGDSSWKQVRKDKREGMARFCPEQEGDVVGDVLCWNKSGVHQAGETRGSDAR